MTERCGRCNRLLDDHGTVWKRELYGQIKYHICPQEKGYAVGEA